VRIADIFGIFDLSFFVSGAVCAAGVLFGAGIFGGWTRVEALVRAHPTGLHIGATVLACYVLGIVCFAAGRKVRQDRTFYADLRRHLHDFGLDERYAQLLPGAKDADATRRSALLYARLWAEVRQAPQLAPSFNLLTRYWVMAAMCDGLAAAFSVWLLLWVIWAVAPLPVTPPSALVFCVGGVELSGAAVLSSIEAKRYGRAQLYELCATLAHRHGGMTPGAVT
jgi:hypothetical protein